MAAHNRRRHRQRGVMLIEMLIVVAIMTLVATGVAVAAYDYWNKTRVSTAGTNARALRHGVKAWRVDRTSDDCPAIERLIADGALDDDSPRADPWGGPWRILCSDGRVTVRSDGPDRKEGTDDDVVVPEGERGRVGE